MPVFLKHHQPLLASLCLVRLTPPVSFCRGSVGVLHAPGKFFYSEARQHMALQSVHVSGCVALHFPPMSYIWSLVRMSEDMSRTDAGLSGNAQPPSSLQDLSEYAYSDYLQACVGRGLARPTCCRHTSTPCSFYSYALLFYREHGCIVQNIAHMLLSCK